MWRCVVVLMWTAAMVRTSASEESLESSLQRPEDPEMLKNDTLRRNVTEPGVRQIWKRCFHKPSTRCIKLTLARLLEHLPSSGLSLGPGVTLLANSSHSLHALGALRALLTADSSGLRLLTPLKQFLGSLTFRVRLEDPTLLRHVKALSEEVVDNLVAISDTEGRKKGEGAAMMWAGGALAAAGMAALAAMAGKALMASMAALMLAAMSAMRGGGDGGGGGGGGGHGKHSHVEIIKAPAHYELAPMPVHHDGGGYAFEHDHYYSASSHLNSGREVYMNGPRLDEGVVSFNK